MPFVKRPCLHVLVALALAGGAAGAQGPSLEYSQGLMHKFQLKKDSVGYAAGVGLLRQDLNSRAKAGTTVEVTLAGDFHFNDGTVLAKGTVLEGTVSAAANHTKANPVSSITVDWTAARLPKKATLPLAAAVRDAQGGVPVKGADHSFGQNQLGATSNSGHAGDNNTTLNNSVLMNQQSGMPQIAPGVTMEPAEGHSLRVTSQNEDIVLREGTKMVLVLFKELAAASPAH